MGIIIIEKNNNEIIRSYFNDTKLINWLKLYNHLDLHINKFDNIKIIFNNNTFHFNFNELYEIYEYDIKHYIQLHLNQMNIFFIDIVKFYNIHFMCFIYKRSTLISKMHYNLLNVYLILMNVYHMFLHMY